MLLLRRLFLVCAAALPLLSGAELQADDVISTDSSQRHNVTVQKCCPLDSVLVEVRFGVRECQKREKLLHVAPQIANSDWEPNFYSLATFSEVIGPRQFNVDVGLPACSGQEYPFPVLVYDLRKEDTLRLLSNGSLTHKFEHRVLPEYQDDEEEEADDDDVIGTNDDVTTTGKGRIYYPPGKYCVDKMVILPTTNGNGSSDSSNELMAHQMESLGEPEVVQFATVCFDVKMEVGMVFEEWVYPMGVALSMACLVATFLLYSVLPQLRDLTGKFILGICTFIVTAFALNLIDIFGWKDANVDKLTTELCLHASVVGIWLCVNCMGHHVWKKIKSKSVFTRTTDGQLLKYYTIYIALCLCVITMIAACVHFFIEAMAQSQTHGGKRFRIGWRCLTAYYTPVALVIIANIYFYWTSQRRMSKQLIYNRSMQHFQVNFDLFTKFLLVVGIWWLFHALALLRMSALSYIAMAFDILLGPLVFLVAMCRTRVAFLFKRYFCSDDCCCCSRIAGNFTNDDVEFIEEECQELATIDNLRERVGLDDLGGVPKEQQLPETKMLTREYLNGRQVDKDLSASLFNVKNVRREPGDVLPPPDPQQPLGRVRRLLKSNSLTALANINFGWRKETSV